MDTARISPQGLIKRIVGEQLVVSVQLNPDYRYQLELFTNVNRVSDTYPFDCEDNVYQCTIRLNKSGFFRWNVRYRREGTKTWRWLTAENKKKITGRVQVDPKWLDDAVVYNVFVRFFNGMIQGNSQSYIPPGEGGTFDDVKAYLSTLSDMGVNVLYFNPIHLIGELYRKHNMLDQLPTYLQPGSPYSIRDYKSIDPELTYDKDTKKYLLADPQKEFKDLVDAAHERGMYVIMDLVFNHTAHDFVFQRIRPEWYLYKDHITSLDDPYLTPADMKEGKPWGDAAHTVAPYDHGVWFEDAAQLNWEYRIPDGPNAPPKNPSLKEMWEYFKAIPKYWIRHFGVDGFRCDIAYKVPPDFWRACIAESREEAHVAKTNLSNDVVFIAEAFTDDLEVLQDAGFSAVYGDFSNKLRRPLDLDGYLNYLYNIHSSHFPQQSKWFIFPEGHDFDRTPQKILGSDNITPDAAYRANKSRWLITATLPGLPLIFNGFEKVEWRPVNLFGYGAVDWKRETDLRDYLALVNRKRHELLPLHLTGEYISLETNQGMDEATQLFAFLRKKDDAYVLVVVNMDVYKSAGPAIIQLPPEFDRVYRLTDELTDQTYLRSGCDLMVILEPGDGHLFSVAFL